MSWLLGNAATAALNVASAMSKIEALQSVAIFINWMLDATLSERLARTDAPCFPLISGEEVNVRHLEDRSSDELDNNGVNRPWKTLQPLGC